MKLISIEDLLRWAFTFELGGSVKEVERQVDCEVGAYGGTWGAIAGLARLGTFVDGGGCSVEFRSSQPHSDAVLVGEAVRGLEAFDFDLPEGWNPCEDLDDRYDLVAGEVESVVSELRLSPHMLGGRRVIGIIVSAALLGKGPQWRMAAPEYDLVSANGKPKWFVRKRARDSFGRTYWCEVDGYDHRRKRPVKGAYRKMELLHSMRADILGRLEWQMWQTALGALADDLRPRLAHHRIRAFQPDMEPWTKMHTTQDTSQAIESAG